MRLFVSINLGEELNDYLAGVQGELEKVVGAIGCGGGGAVGAADSVVPSLRSGLRFALAGRKSGFHLTLFFLGEVPVEKVLDLQKELAAISFEPFKLKFKNRLGVFKGGGFGQGGGFIKAVFVDIDKNFNGYKSLLGLQKMITDCVGEFGFRDGRPFSPHITLARVGFYPREIAGDFEKVIFGVEVSDREFDVDAFYLMESELEAGGSRYSEVLKVVGR